MHEVTNKSTATLGFWVRKGKERAEAFLKAGETKSLALINRDSTKIRTLEDRGQISIAGPKAKNPAKDEKPAAA